ncbi:DUF5687 family protein [Salinibacter grassmerensis]|uniref:DUF5687 family protein n=1 Tax=Salinibacter grassmerensis TaxID=3040353 RepID=UPI0021E88BFD|nr:DUF5687 family protein [Salinibacter grassmerensis]
MTLLDVLRHRWTRWRRSTTLGRSLLTTVLVVLAGVHVGGWAVALGWFYPDIVAEVFPGRDPLRLLNEHLLSGMAGLVGARFVLQRFDAGAWRSLLCLPVRRATLARAIQVTSAISLLTLVPLLGLAALAARTVASGTSPLGVALWTAAALLAVGMTHFACVWLRVAWIRRRWSGFLGASAVVLGLVGGDFLGATVIQEASAWLFGGPLRGSIGALLVLAVGTVTLAVVSTAALRRYTYESVGGPDRTDRRRRFSVDIEGREGLSSLVFLEGALIFRNRGPREQLLIGSGTLAFFVYLIVRDALSVFSVGMAPFLIGLLLSVAYGQFAFAWHGKHFDGLLVRVSPGRLVRGTLVVLTGLAAGPLILAMPVVAWADPFLAAPMAAFALYHAGITVPTIVGTGILWNRNWVNPEQSRFTFSGGPIRGMVLMALLSVPPVLLGLGGIPVLLSGVAVLGGLGLGTVSLWRPRLEAMLRRRRHAMLRGFRGGWLSPHEWHW